MFSLIVNTIVIVGMIYLTFLMALAGWVASLRKGQAVTLLPERGKRRWPAWAQIAFVLLSLVIAGALFYALWIPLSLAVPASTALLLTICGLVLFLAGVILTLWARRTLGAMWGISTSRQVKLLPDHQIIQTGPMPWCGTRCIWAGGSPSWGLCSSIAPGFSSASWSCRC